MCAGHQPGLRQQQPGYPGPGSKAGGPPRMAGRGTHRLPARADPHPLRLLCHAHRQYRRPQQRNGCSHIRTGHPGDHRRRRAVHPPRLGIRGWRTGRRRGRAVPQTAGRERPTPHRSREPAPLRRPRQGAGQSAAAAQPAHLPRPEHQHRHRGRWHVLSGIRPQPARQQLPQRAEPVPPPRGDQVRPELWRALPGGRSRKDGHRNHQQPPEAVHHGQ